MIFVEMGKKMYHTQKGQTIDVQHNKLTSN